MQALMAHNWPGNVRELRNIAERFVLGLSSGTDGLLSERSLAPVPLADQVGAFERAVIEQELRKAGGSVTAVSLALGVPKQTLYYKLQKYGLTADGYKS
jgi:two-component system C4-dicarboxylate transport response regulator DctD